MSTQVLCQCRRQLLKSAAMSGLLLQLPMVLALVLLMQNRCLHGPEEEAGQLPCWLASVWLQELLQWTAGGKVR